MMLQMEPCKCEKCGCEQQYDLVLSASSFMHDMMPINKCQKCGRQLTSADILLEKCSPDYRRMYRMQKITERQKEIALSEGYCPPVCKGCGSQKLLYVVACGLKLPDGYSEGDGYVLRRSYHQCLECGLEVYETCEHVKDPFEYINTLEDGHTLLFKKKSNYDAIIEQNEKDYRDGVNKIEDQLILDGVLPSREWEGKYKQEYYKMHRGWAVDVFDSNV